VIRINLIGAERLVARPAGSQRRVGAACALILMGTALVCSWLQWSLFAASAQVDADLATMRQEAARLQPRVDETNRLEQRRAELRRRVATVQQMRASSSLSVQLLDHVSRSLPDRLWLTSLQQQGNQLTIEGGAASLIELSELVGRLEDSPLLHGRIEIVSSRLDSDARSSEQTRAVESIHFTLKAQIAGPAS
jgi:type IV pilus assembly protein PilN